MNYITIIVMFRWYVNIQLSNLRKKTKLIIFEVVSMDIKAAMSLCISFYKIYYKMRYKDSKPTFYVYVPVEFIAYIL